MMPVISFDRGFIAIGKVAVCSREYFEHLAGFVNVAGDGDRDPIGAGVCKIKVKIFCDRLSECVEMKTLHARAPFDHVSIKRVVHLLGTALRAAWRGRPGRKRSRHGSRSLATSFAGAVLLVRR